MDVWQLLLVHVIQVHISLTFKILNRTIVMIALSKCVRLLSYNLLPFVLYEVSDSLSDDLQAHQSLGRGSSGFPSATLLIFVSWLMYFQSNASNINTNQFNLQYSFCARDVNSTVGIYCLYLYFRYVYVE